MRRAGHGATRTAARCWQRCWLRREQQPSPAAGCDGDIGRGSGRGRGAWVWGVRDGGGVAGLQQGDGGRGGGGSASGRGGGGSASCGGGGGSRRRWRFEPSQETTPLPQLRASCGPTAMCTSRRWQPSRWSRCTGGRPVCNAGASSGRRRGAHRRPVDLERGEGPCRLDHGRGLSTRQRRGLYAFLLLRTWRCELRLRAQRAGGSSRRGAERREVQRILAIRRSALGWLRSWGDGSSQRRRKTYGLRRELRLHRRRHWRLDHG